MNTQQSAVWLGLILSTTLGPAGCGDPDSPGLFPLHSVVGSVVLEDGNPLTSGRVVLVSRERAMEFEGKLDPEGSFRVGSNLGDGVPEGSYRIRIEPDEASLPHAKNKAASRKWRLPFPVRYSNEDTSNLTANITPGANRLEPFQLTVPARKSTGKGAGRGKN